MNVWIDPTHLLKRQLDRCTHFRTTMQQSYTAWNTIPYLWRQNVTLIELDMWPPDSPDLNPVYYTIWVVLHFLLYAIYICQKSLNFTYAFKCYQQNCSWLHFTWTTLYSSQYFAASCSGDVTTNHTYQHNGDGRAQLAKRFSATLHRSIQWLSFYWLLWYAQLGLRHASLTGARPRYSLLGWLWWGLRRGS